MGAVVKGYALETNTTPSLFTEAKVGQNMDSEIGDIRDLNFIVKSMMSFNPEVLIHGKRLLKLYNTLSTIPKRVILL